MAYIYFDVLSCILSGICSNILPDFLSGKYCGILSGILSGIYLAILAHVDCGIQSGSLSGIYADIPSGINFGILSRFYSDILSGIYSDRLCDYPSGAIPDICFDILSGSLSLHSAWYPGILSGMSSIRSWRYGLWVQALMGKKEREGTVAPLKNLESQWNSPFTPDGELHD